MDLGLASRNCVVIGGSRGIGRAIALGLAAEGANVAICARGADGLDDAQQALRAHGGRVHAATCDAGDASALQGFLEGARAALGGVDVLVHNASALSFGAGPEDWDACVRVDLLGAAAACRVVMPWMKEAGGGSILLVTSISGLEASPAPDVAYTSVKGALIALAKKLALLHARDGIRVNALAPGSIEFPGGVWERAKQHAPELYAAARGSIPWGRMGKAEEVADVAAFLVSPRARWMTGECVSVDGGQHRGMR